MLVSCRLLVGLLLFVHVCAVHFVTLQSPHLVPNLTELHSLHVSWPLSLLPKDDLSSFRTKIRALLRGIGLLSESDKQTQVQAKNLKLMIFSYYADDSAVKPGNLPEFGWNRVINSGTVSGNKSLLSVE